MADFVRYPSSQMTSAPQERKLKFSDSHFDYGRDLYYLPQLAHASGQCVSCGILTSLWCTGLSGKKFLAVDRIPHQQWAVGQKTPLCS